MVNVPISLLFIIWYSHFHFRNSLNWPFKALVCRLINPNHNLWRIGLDFPCKMYTTLFRDSTCSSTWKWFWLEHLEQILLGNGQCHKIRIFLQFDHAPIFLSDFQLSARYGWFKYCKWYLGCSEFFVESENYWSKFWSKTPTKIFIIYIQASEIVEPSNTKSSYTHCSLSPSTIKERLKWVVSYGKWVSLWSLQF